MPPWPGARSSAPRRLAPLAVRGHPGRAGGLVGQRIAAIRRRGKFLLVDLDRDRIVVNPMLTGRFQLAAPEAKHPTKTALVVGFGPRTGGPPGGRGDVDARRGLAAARRRIGRDPLPRPDPDGQGLPAADRGRPGRARARRGARPGRRRSAPRASTTGERASGAIRASSRTCSRTRRSSPGSATPTATRSCTQPGCCRSASGRRWRRRRSTPCTTRPARPCARRDRGPARARPADLRDAGPRLPGRPQQGRHALPALRHADHRGQAGRVRDLVLPGLPALSRRQGILSTWPGLMSVSLIPLSVWSALTVVPNRIAIEDSVSPGLTV